MFYMVIFRDTHVVTWCKLRSSVIRTFWPKIFIKIFYLIVNQDNMKNLLNKEAIRNKFF